MSSDEAEEDTHRWWRLAAGFALLFAFIYIIPRIGFVPATMVFCVVFLLAAG